MKKEQKNDLAIKNAIEKTTGVDFRNDDEIVDPKIIELLQKNSSDPIVIAQYIINDYPGLVKVVSSGEEKGALYLYNGSHYNFLDDSALDVILVSFCLKYKITSAFKNVGLIIRALNAHPNTPRIEKVNPFDNLINLNNGTLNIHTKEFTPHSMFYYFDYKLTIDYDPEDKDCPNYKKFLNDVFSGREDDIKNIVRLGGYLLDSSCKAKKCFFFDGDGSTGKSTLIDSFTMFFPDRRTNPVVSSLSLSNLASEGYNKTDLITSRLNVSAESRKARYDSEFLKAMVTGDYIKIDRKFLDPYTFRYQGKVIIAGNGLPSVNDTSDGTFRRIIIFTFKNKFHSAEKIARNPFAKKQGIKLEDVDLFEKIKSEASAILNLFIDGLLDLRKNNYKFVESEESLSAMEAFKRDSDTTRDFLESNYVIDYDNTLALEKIFEHYRVWYQDNVQDNRAMKFRSSELGKRIKEVFGVDGVGREYYYNPVTKESKRSTVYNLSPIKEDDDEEEETEKQSVSEEIKQLAANFGGEIIK